MCEIFGCTPDAAEELEPTKVARVIEYRAARRAVELFNQGAKGLEQMVKAPVLAAVLRDMMRAQESANMSVDDIYSHMAARAEPEG